MGASTSKKSQTGKVRFFLEADEQIHCRKGVSAKSTRWVKVMGGLSVGRGSTNIRMTVLSDEHGEQKGLMAEADQTELSHCYGMEMRESF